MPLSAKQIGVLKGMIGALAVAGTGLAAGAAYIPVAEIRPVASPPRLTASVLGLLPLGLVLMSTIGALARHRFFTPQDIDGGGLTSGTQQARVLQAILQNTLEQSALALIAYVCFAAAAPVSMLGVLPAAAGLFVVGRLLFWKGYAHGAEARAFGFALTFYSSSLVLLAAALFALATFWQ